MTQRHVVRVGPDDSARDPFVEVPFEVGDDATAIEVRYRHDAGSIIDLGLLDPRIGPFPSVDGFRGWSGGARDHVVLTPTVATPGYLPGPLTRGTWRVLLGLASVAPDGCEVQVEVTVHRAAPPDVPGRPPPQGAARADPEDRARRDDADTVEHGWYRADLQSHSHHSDARGSLLDLRTMALARGLDVLAVTDHNTISHHAPLDALRTPALLWVPGMELTTYRGHANVWGVDGWIDFRVRSDDDVTTLLRHVHERGGVLSINHPKHSPGCIGCDWAYPSVPSGVDCLEAWQGPWWLGNWESLERYDALLREGRRLTLVGGSDRHQPPLPDDDPPELQLGSPTTWLHLERRSLDAVLATLCAGRVTVSEGPHGPFLAIGVDGTPMGATLATNVVGEATAHVDGAAGERLRWLSAAGVVREVAIDDPRFVDRWRPGPIDRFLRAEVVADGSLAARRQRLANAAALRPLPYGLTIDAAFAQPYRLALSNPVYAPH